MGIKGKFGKQVGFLISMQIKVKIRGWREQTIIVGQAEEEILL